MLIAKSLDLTGFLLSTQHSALSTQHSALCYILSLSLSHDEQTLLSGSQDKAINYWDLTTRECWTTLRPARPYKGTLVNAATELTEAQM
ncbi:hypothetical protein [Nostoc sp. LPT]|uniref:hypothetical protein n=1 Tax=Nostoc sp. LPT TaxID=2815387 RepID=UPI001DADC0B9|nr:hypothetical protein [Nostoc sp. LPT]MBN4001991.1 hypothetical protein [Nostoc sp. LPT]